MPGKEIIRFLSVNWFTSTVESSLVQAYHFGKMGTDLYQYSDD